MKATRRRRSTLSDLHHMVLIHSENEATEEINHSNNEIENIVQSNSATGDLTKSIHSIVNVDDNVGIMATLNASDVRVI